MSSRRVVVTGLGAVTPLGMSAAESWQALINGKSGVRSIELQVPNKAPLKGVAARLPRPIDDSKLTKLAINQRPVSQFIKYALASALMALEDACLLNDARLPDSIGDRCGVSIGSGIGGIDECVEAVNRVPRVSPFFVPRLLSNMAAGNVSIAFDLRGPNHSVATACAAGAHSIGDGMRFIQAGDADVMVVGGSEACISPLAISGFTRYDIIESFE